MKRNRTLKFFLTLFIVLAILAGAVVGGYFILDRKVVPKYFGEFGINNMHELVGMMTTLYSTNDEKDIVKNGYTEADQKTAEEKLTTVGFPKLSSGGLDYKTFSEGGFSPDQGAEVVLTDRELASILDGMLQSGVLADKLPSLRYINTLNMELLELKITPEIVENTLNSGKADCLFTIKIDTSSIRQQIASEMEMPLFLLNMIMPKDLFVTMKFTLEDDGENWNFTGQGIGVNGKTSKQSQILLSLLIKFIFPAEDEMTSNKLESQLGQVVIEGTKLLGSGAFTNEIYSSKQNGVIITLK